MITIMSSLLSNHFAFLPGETVTLDPGQLLFARGDLVTRMHIVEEGAVQLVRHHAHGAAVILQQAYSGDLVAEAAMFSRKYHCDALAVTAARLHSIPKQHVVKALETGGELAVALAAHLSAQLQRARQRAEILSLGTVARRLDGWLALHDDEMPLRGHWKRVAMEIGVSPEALYRELARRRKEDAVPGRTSAGREPE